MFTCQLYAQDYDIIQINSLPKNGLLLNSGWKFQAEDNPRYADPDFDDSMWKPINPATNIVALLPEIKNGIGWLRLHFSLHEDLQKAQLAFLVEQYIASEIYLNGSLVYRFGTVSTMPNEIVAYNPGVLPVALPIDRSARYVLAVRYVVQPKLNYNIDGSTLIPMFKMTVYPVNAAFELVRKVERHIPVTNTFRVGAVFILAFLYLAFFIYNPTQKAYLFFFLFTIFLIPGDILQMNIPATVKDAFTVFRLYYILWLISGLFLLTAMYSLLHQKKGWIFWSLIIATITGIIINSWVFTTLIIGNLTNIELVRTCFKALRIKTRGAWIITAGAVGFLLLIGAFLIGAYFQLGYWYLPLGESYIFADVLYGLGNLSIPVATTIYIALDFDFTSRRLKQKLGEVEYLSKQSLEQQKEKQQILASLNETLEKQVSERTAELNKSLNNLKSTQAQLIQSEKMASLGELTAGIAHEIQNPLNFVNNFSEINKELAEELKSELAIGNLQLAADITTDIADNSEKINHHGKRADAIVKGMLQHSRTSTGQKEPTDINALADEYLRLSYHGIRAKDKSFNATLQTDFDNSIGKINIIPQDIGRIFLNLYNNAFYAVNEKSKQLVAGYEPTVTISTKKIENKIEIRVIDIGNGISEKILDKIFQPFFTTKPTGQGTGLGLSLSYDIVKAHGGEIKVNSVEEGTEFIILLPTH